MAPAALAKLEQARESLKDVLTHLELQLQDDATAPMDQATASFLYNMLTTAHTDNINTHKLIRECNPPVIADHQKEFSDICKRITVLMSGYAGINSRFVPAVPVIPHGTSAPDVRLPKLELPTFDGTLNQWVSFHDLFTNTIHSKAKLSKCEKLTYLKSLLRGDAARLIQTLVVSDANYDLAWQKLIDRYQNERELVFSVFKRYLAQPNLPQATSNGVRELVDVSLECVRSLEVFNIRLEKGLDAFLMFLLFRKLDDATRQLWEQQLTTTTLPTFQALVDFLEQRARALSASGSVESAFNGPNKPSHCGDRNRPPTRASVHHTQTTCQVCCQSYHPMFKCPSFSSLSVHARHDAAKKARVCFNCLSDGHGAQSCPSTRSCRQCNERHHTLLHRQQQQQSGVPVTQERRDPPVQTMHTAAPQPPSVNETTETLLATAIVLLTDRHGRTQQCRALLDSCSTKHFITEECSRRLGLVHKRTHMPISGLGQEAVGVAKSIAHSSVSPHFDPSEKMSVQFLVVPKITSKIPCKLINPQRYPHLNQLQLADPQYFRPSKIDLLLGSDIFYAVIGTEKKSGDPSDPVAINTSLGWLVGGGKDSPATPTSVMVTHTEVDPCSSMSTEEEEALDATLRKFWELEAVPATRILTPDEEKCEDHFNKTTKRQEDGRFIVSLPKKTSSSALGLSQQIAVRRLQQVERRLAKNSTHREDYLKFMKEYEDMGHMVEVEPPLDNSETVFIPHHFVLKESSTTTKFRVVFDASAKTSTGVSLNDTLLVGPTVQDTLADLIMRFRTHLIALTGDIAKMYRQVLINPAESHLQHILWRDDPRKPIKFYKLLTITYGTAPAPYLATRTMKELVALEGSRFPLAAATLTNDFYVDDLMTGTSSVSEAIALRPQLQDLCSSGGFPLRKWTSSSQKVLESIPPEFRETQSLLSLDSDPTIKALGIFWNAKEDCFMFKSSSTICKSSSTHVTKRELSSSIARLFDPIGWLAPVIIGAKILMQKTWAAEIPWDAKLPQQLQDTWSEMLKDFGNLERIQIPRYYGFNSEVTNLRASTTTTLCLIGFCDASEVAYAAAVYIGVYKAQSTPVINLITAKTRVAPCKKVSLPRLELCGALLLAELISSVNTALKINFDSITAWSDSTVALAWIRGHPSKWPTFVANRVTKIQSLVPSASWGHVSGVTNPADCASRGITSSELVDHPLWWHGPQWLLDGIPSPQDTGSEHPLPEESPIVLVTTPTEHPSHYMDKFSDLHRLQRVTLYMLKFVSNCRAKCLQRLTDTNSSSSVSVSHVESRPDMKTSLFSLIKWTQSIHFEEDIRHLQQHASVSKKSRLLSLSPFLDDNGILRVGGRLRHSKLPVDQKNPVLLPSRDHLTKLIIRAAHLDNFHAGPQLIQATLFQQFWILRGRDSIRHQVKKCVTCTRHAAKTQEQYMGDLPSSRVSPCRPFEKMRS